MIVSVARNYDWASPLVLNDLYTDSLDHLGLEFWYKDAKNMQSKNK